MKNFVTDYGLHFSIVEKAKIGEFLAYDLTIARCHIARFNYIIIDSYNTPIDNEYDLDAIQEVLRDIHF